MSEEPAGARASRHRPPSNPVPLTDKSQNIRFRCQILPNPVIAVLTALPFRAGDRVKADAPGRRGVVLPIRHGCGVRVGQNFFDPRPI